MVNGQVIAVAKYHLNSCYNRDLSGEFPMGSNTVLACRGTDENIVVSTSQSLSLNAGATTIQPLVFDFSSNPIPLAATDLLLQVVYRGKLGHENDAVAVTTLDISEPTTFTIINMTDYFLLNGTFYKIPAPFDQTTVPSQVDPALFAYIDANQDNVYDLDAWPHGDLDLSRESLSYHFDFGGGTTLGTLVLPASSFARFSVLMNTAQGTLHLTKETYGYDINVPLAPSVNQYTPNDAQHYTIPTLFRGIYKYLNSPDFGYYPTLAPIPPGLDPLLNMTPRAVSIQFPLQ
jgi:hypothetical protein